MAGPSTATATGGSPSVSAPTTAASATAPTGGAASTGVQHSRKTTAYLVGHDPAGSPVEATSWVNGVVATFSDSDGNTNGSAYSVTIDWGDRTALDTTSGSASYGGTGSIFNVSGTHTYAEEGDYTATVNITDTLDGSRQTVRSPLHVQDAPLGLSFDNGRLYPTLGSPVATFMEFCEPSTHR
jgi:hypothetical protein